MKISDEEILLIQEQLLGHGFAFNDQQKNVIRFQGNNDFIACPGSGKTTVLIAKLAIIMNKMKKDSPNQGICIITHTNVGVEEIRSSLKKTGISDVKYPHFIGTIHEFFNHYFSIKAYGLLFKDKKFNLLEEEDYRQKFGERFMKVHRPNWYDVENNPPGKTTLSRIMLEIVQYGDLSLIGLETKSDEYRKSLLNTLTDMFNNGDLRHEDTVSLAEWYINKNLIKIRSAFSQRFKYMFIDEAQDTSDPQMKVISKITENNSEITLQSYGDPYQSLYNLDGDLPDGWKPDEETSIQISLSNRFGDRIAEVLRTTCIAPYPILQGNPSIFSQKPHAFVYSEDNRNQVLSKYAETLKQISRNNAVIPLDNGKICAISSHHIALNEYYAGYEKGLKLSSKVSLQKQCLNEFQKMLYSMLYEKTGTIDSFLGPRSIKEFIKEFEDKRLLPSNLQLRTFLVIWMKNIKNSQSTQFKEFEQELINWFEARYSIDISNEDISSRISVLEKQIQKILSFETSTTSVQDNTYNCDGIQINLNTVHGVKGETHCATLFLESNFHRNGLAGTDVTDIFDFMAGEFDHVLCTDPNINKSLKLAYVAFSRPRYFIGVAFNRNNVSVEKIAKLERSGWEIVEV